MSSKSIAFPSTDAVRSARGKHATGQRIAHAVYYVILLALATLLLMPLAWMLSTSLKRASEVFVIPLQWIPPHITWSNYPQAINDFPFWTFLKNSLIYGVGATT